MAAGEDFFGNIEAEAEEALKEVEAENEAIEALAVQTPISANCYWNSDNCDPANFTVPAGVTVRFWAKGTWLTHPHGPDTQWNGPEGNGVPNKGSYPCAGPESCMVIFTSLAVPPVAKPNPVVWDWFKSNDQTFNYTNDNAYPVTIYFAANDDTSDNAKHYDDNQGVITVYSLQGDDDV